MSESFRPEKYLPFHKMPEGFETNARGTYQLPPDHFDLNPVFIEARSPENHERVREENRLKQIVELFGSDEALTAAAEARKLQDREIALARLHAQKPTEANIPEPFHAPVYAPDLTEIPSGIGTPMLPGEPIQLNVLNAQPRAFAAD